MSGLYGDSVFGQVNFRLAILAVPECQNGIDDDTDGLIDFPDDPDCSSSSDNSEQVIVAPSPPTVACSALPSTTLIGQPVTWLAIASGGDGTYTYTWSGTESLTGTDSSVTKTYASIGIKTAAVTVTSGSLSSAPTTCTGSVLITAPIVPPPGGGGGGGGGSGTILPPPTHPKDPDIPHIPPFDAAPPEGDESCKNIQYDTCPIPLPQSPFSGYKDYLVCTDFIVKRATEKEYNYLQYTARKELLGIAVEMNLRDRNPILCEEINHLSSQIKQLQLLGTPSLHPFHFLDVGIAGQSDWILETVEKGVALGLISSENTHFRPDDDITRAEAFSVMMKSVCMNPAEHGTYATWEERVYDTARRYNITVRSWQDFGPQRPILRQEIFVIATKLDVWRDATGGCTPRPQPKPFPPIIQGMAPLAGLPSVVSEVQNTQQPGTFALLYDNEAEKVSTYIIKSGGVPDGVRAQYIRVFGGTKNTAQRLSIHDISGVEYPEDRWLLSGEMVYVTFKK